MRVRSADKHLWQDAEKACQLLKRATGAIRNLKFWVRSSENLELRTSNLGRLAFPASLACLVPLSCGITLLLCHTCGPSKF